LFVYSRNNGYAISTPTSEQYRGDGIVSRGPGYGIESVRVDGNDMLAVYNVTKLAREFCLKENRPFLIEAMTYRVGHHSTSDDSSAYRSPDDVESQGKKDNPINRAYMYLVNRGIWSESQEKELKSEQKQRVMNTFKEAEGLLKPAMGELFQEVYDKMPLHLERQFSEMQEHVANYSDQYPTNFIK
jgi:2-oxoisovalerate dehydrogenase E1 component alpha subunit